PRVSRSSQIPFLSPQRSAESLRDVCGRCPALATSGPASNTMQFSRPSLPVSFYKEKPAPTEIVRQSPPKLQDPLARVKHIRTIPRRKLQNGIPQSRHRHLTFPALTWRMKRNIYELLPHCICFGRFAFCRGGRASASCAE